MSNVEVGIKINAKINENINKQIDELEKKFSDMQTDANKIGFGGKIKDDIQSAKAEVAQLKEEFKDVFTAFKTQKIDASEFNKFVKSTEASLAEMRKQIVNVEENMQRLTSAFKMGQNSSSFEKRLSSLQQQIDSFVNKTQEGITALTEFNKMVNSDTTVKIKGDTSELGKDLDQKVSSFSFKKGGIKVPVSLDATQLPKLQKKYNEIIGMLQSYADANPVDVTMRLFPLNTTKAGAKEVTEAVKNVQAQIATLPEGELKTSMNSLYDNLEKQYQKAVRLKIDVDLGETQASIKQRIKELNDAVKEQGFTIYPNFDIEDVDADKISSKLSELQEKITVKTTSEIKSMSDSLTNLFNTSNVEAWSKQFNNALDSIQTKLNSIVPLMNQLTGITNTETKNKNIKNSVPNEQDVNVLVEFTNAMKALRESLTAQQNAQLNINIDPLMEKLDVLRATIAMVHSGLGNIDAGLSNVKGDGHLQVIYTTLQKIEGILTELNSNKNSLNLKVQPDVDVESFINKIQAQIQASSGVKVPISVLEASIDSFINEIQFAIDSRLTNGDIGTESFLPNQDNNLGSNQITALNRRVGSLKEKIDSTWSSWYEFAQAAISGTDLAKEGIVGVTNKLEELAWGLQTVSSNFTSIDFSKQIGDINVLKNIVDINSNASSSASAISAEAKSMGEIYSKALQAAEAKEKFSAANKEVLQSIINSLSALNSEGNGFENLNKIIKNLANNKNDRITDMVANLELLRDALSSPVSDDSFIRAIQEISSQGENLNSLATVLKASVSQLQSASEVIKTTETTKTQTDSEANLQRRIELYNQINKLQTEIYKYQASGTSVNDTRIIDRTIEIDQLREELSVLEQLELTEEQLATLNAETSKSAQALGDAEAKAMQRAEKEAANYESKVISLKKQLSSMMNNGKLMNYAGDSIKSLFAELDTGVPFERLKQIENEIKTIQTRANETGNTGKTLLQQLIGRFQSLATYLGSFASFYRIVSYVRSAFTTLVDLDTQLVDLRKTTSMTTSELNEFYSASSDVAKELGTTTSQIISQAAAWSRLGYSTKEASTEMAKLSSQFAAISPGMTTDESTDYLVSTMQAYGIAVDEVERKVMDNVNRIGNTFATTNAEIGEMLTRSSAAMHAANNSLEETIALESAAVEITRNAETTGTAFRTISMRIRGYDEETEELSDDLQNISGDIADLTKTSKNAPISIFTDATRTEYKSTYQILKEIAGVWENLTDKQQANKSA